GCAFRILLAHYYRALGCLLSVLRAVRRRRLMLTNVDADLRGRVERHVLAVAQTNAELAVVDGLPAERGYSNPRKPTKRLDLPEQGFRRAEIQFLTPPSERLGSFAGRYDTPRSHRMQYFFCPLSSPRLSVGSIPSQRPRRGL